MTAVEMFKPLTAAEAVERIHNAAADYHGDNEAIHGAVDLILLRAVPEEVRDAYLQLTDKVEFWYA